MCTHRAAQSVFITMTISPSDHSVSPPNVLIPRDYNAAADLLGRHASRKHKPAYIDGLTGATLSYAQLSEQAHRFAQGLQDQGFVQEQRVLLCMHDSLHWPVAFLGCILAGVVPIAVNTLLTTQDYHFMLRDSRAQGLIISQALWPVFEPLMPALVGLKQIIIDGGHASTPGISLADLLRRPDVSYEGLMSLDAGKYQSAELVEGLAAGDVSRETTRAVIEQVEIAAKYSGYIDRQRGEVERAAFYEHLRLPESLDYMQVSALSIEARQKLAKHRPETLGQASRISGITPASVSLLLIHLKKGGFKGFMQAAEEGAQA